MRALVTGGHGFVGRWLLEHLTSCGDDVVAPHQADVDVTDPAAVRSLVDDVAPEAVYHLAGLAHVGASWDDPDAYLRVNGGGTLHVLEAVRCAATPARVLVVSSAEVYGAVRPDQLPIDEDDPLRPISPYAASKAAAELYAVQAHQGRGLHVVRARPFNHIGPGQDGSFVVPAFARRIVTALRDGEPALRVGNLSARRDLTDVRDVVRAYRLLVERGEPGAVYNVCSGRDVAIDRLVRRMLAIAGADLELRPDPDLMRPADIPVLRGDPTAVRLATGWRPEVPLQQSLADVLAEWKAEP